MQFPEKLIPMGYLLAVAVIGGGLHYLGVPPEMNGMIVGAGLTRVKIGAPKEGASAAEPTPKQ